jgi:hypothetical protein
MDVSKLYVEMCEKAEEIQDECPTAIMEVIKSFFRRKDPLNNDIWLPRQDQLQEMIKTESNFDLIKEFRDWQMEDKKIKIDWLLNWSMEQLWLAFVMKKKYGNTWDGKEWVAA